MDLRRGFRAEANWYAREMRRELGLRPNSPLCPWELAVHLNFLVVALSEFKELAPSAVAYFSLEGGRREFSAATLFHDEAPVIVHNDSHDLKRQAANIAHELAHALLLHPPARLLDDTGAREFRRKIEAEANWLGPALLVSEEAALFIARQGMSIEQASDLYRVSNEVIRMRLNVTGALKRVA